MTVSRYSGSAGYVSSDDEDDFDFGYSDPLVKRSKSPILPTIQNKRLRDELHSALEHNKKVHLFLRAVDEGDLNVLEELISLGVSVDSSGPQEWTPLMEACGMGKVEVVSFLLNHGSNPNLHKELFTPLMACCTFTPIPQEVKLECVRLLLERGAEVNSKDKYKTTALMYAAGSGYEEIVNELLAVEGIDVNIQDKEGWHALFYAVNSNKVEIVKKLLTAGSNLNFKDRYDRTVLNLALDKNLKEVAELLGYVEESQTELPKFDNKHSTTHILNELPDSNGFGGFSSDVQTILSLFNQFNLQEISLPDFLNATDEDLYNIGVHFQYDRRKILTEGIHRYHLHPWKKSSINQIQNGVPLHMEEAIAITANLIKHLSIANASLRYLQTRVSSRSNLQPPNLSTEKELIKVLVHTYETVNRLRGTLRKILNHVSQIKLSQPADFIQSYPNLQKRKAQSTVIKYFWYTIGVTTAGYAIYHFRSRT